MMLATREDALRVVPILHHDHRGADDILALGVVRLLDQDIADEMRVSRGRRLYVDTWMFEPLDARAHEIVVVIKERGLVERAGLPRHRRYPIGAVLGEQLHPFAKAPLVEQPRLGDHELLETPPIDRGLARRTPRWGIHHAASRI